MQKHWLILLFVLLLGTSVRAQDDLIGPDTYPENINPLTGQPVDDPAMLDKRPLIIKIINAPAEVRPQYGLMQADIVWEHLLAGGITRFSAIFYGNEPTLVGPIRSARLVDFELIRIYRGLLTYSGMADGTIQIMNSDPLVLSRMVGGTSPCPALCRSEELNEKLEYTLFGSVPDLYLLAEDKERDTEPEPVNGMAFSIAIPEGGTPIDQITVAYANTLVQWAWDDDMGKWVRSQDGELHLDAETGEPITADNVIIFEEEHTEQPFVRDQFWGPANFAFSVNFIGDGRAIYLRDGHYFEGEWRRETQTDVLTYFTTNGETWAFKPGNTFINLMPRWADAYELTFSGGETLEAEVTVSSANLRSGPGTGYPVLAPAFGGDMLEAIGRNGTGDWVQLRLEDGKVVWGSTQIITVEGDVQGLPLVRPTIEG